MLLSKMARTTPLLQTLRSSFSIANETTFLEMVR